jgi:hypothetical protein
MLKILFFDENIIENNIHMWKTSKHSTKDIMDNSYHNFIFVKLKLVY